MTWFNTCTDDKKFLQECFRERPVIDASPEKPRLVLVPVNLGDIHRGLMVIDVPLKEVYFDGRLRPTFSKMSIRS